MWYLRIIRNYTKKHQTVQIPSRKMWVNRTWRSRQIRNRMELKVCRVTAEPPLLEISTDTTTVASISTQIWSECCTAKWSPCRRDWNFTSKLEIAYRSRSEKTSKELPGGCSNYISTPCHPVRYWRKIHRYIILPKEYLEVARKLY